MKTPQSSIALRDDTSIRPHSSQIKIIQAYRALAAIMVVAYHFKIIFKPYIIGHFPYHLGVVLNAGYIGVDFFFTLSGFIILNSHYDKSDNTKNLSEYFLRRAIRIFPPYIPISIAYLAVNFLKAKFEIKHDANISIVSSLFLLPYFGKPALGVAWTLVYEMAFYSIFSIYFLRRKYFAILVIFWVSLITLNAPFTLALPRNIPSFSLLDTIYLEFVGGLICAYIWRRVNASPATAGLLLVAGITSLAPALWTVPFAGRWILTVPFSLILLGGCYLEKGKALKTPRLPILLGDASYAIYLVHWPVISVLFRVVSAINTHMAHASTAAELIVILFFSIMASILAGVLYHKLYEVPIIRFLNRKMRPPQKAAIPKA
ncbi:acyltransferase [Azospirillum sp. B506]|uniref:acyltransferase family protein n=1 Tax=Azospirillum sp. B506 TaxID=137721 RepID=UPI0005B2AB4E|nr:acyltransferase [Azospirillum sp. B506]